jgi:hypothetical protein
MRHAHYPKCHWARLNPELGGGNAGPIAVTTAPHGWRLQ